MKVMLRYFIVLGILAGATWAVYVGLDKPPLGIDDAHIFFAYAQNIVAGEGIVYNVGGERVEGFTSPLWMAVITFAFALFARPEGFLLLINLCTVAAALTALWWMVDGGPRLTPRGWLFLAWTFSSPSLIIWMTVSLMDAALWGSLLMLGTVVVLQPHINRVHLTLLTVLLLLTRPEGMLWALVFIGVAGLHTGFRQGVRAVWGVIWGALLTYGMTLIALTGARLLYFGYPFPNTYYAKMSPDRIYNLIQGVRYLATFVYYNWHILLIGILPPVAGLFLELPRLLKSRPLMPITLSEATAARLRYVLLSLIGATLIGVPMLTGGDHFNLSRFYQLAWPLFIVFAYAMLDVLDIRRPSLHPLVLALIACAFIVFPGASWLNGRYSEYSSFEFELVETEKLAGEMLSRLFPADPPAVGVTAAGGIATTYHGEVVDVLGLNNITVAHTPGNRYGLKNHAAFNREVFLESLQPDLFLPIVGSPAEICERWIERRPRANFIVNGMLDDEGFLKKYALAYLSDTQGHSILIYVRSDFVDILRERGYIVAFTDELAGCLPAD